MLLEPHGKPPSPENLDGDAEDEVWKYIQWDLETLFRGIHPLLDATSQPWPMCSAESNVQGQPLAGCFLFVPWTVNGDFEYYANVLGLEHRQRAVVSLHAVQG